MVAGTSAASPLRVAGAPGMAPVTSGGGAAVDDRRPHLLPHETQVAAVELRHHGGQPVGAQRLGGPDPDPAVGAHRHLVEGGVIGAGVIEADQPVLFVAEGPVDLLDPALVFGGHVE